MKKGIQLVLLLISSATVSAQTNVVDSLQRVVALHRRDTIEINALLNLTNEYMRTDLVKATGTAHKALTLAHNLKNSIHEGSGYFYLANIYQNLGKNDSALYYLNLLDAVSKANPGTPMLRANYNHAAGLFYKNQGQFRKALTFMIANLDLLKKENEGRAGMFLNIGNVYHNLSDYKNAVSYHFKALTLFEKLKSKRGQSFSLLSLGNDFLNLNQFEQAKKYCEQSLKIKEEEHDKRGVMTTSHTLGKAHDGLGHFAEAEKLFISSANAARELKLPADESRSLFELAILYKRKGDEARAREHIAKCLVLAKAAGDSTLTAKINSERLGWDFQAQKEKLSETKLIGNLNTLLSSGDQNGIGIEYFRLSEYYADRKQFEKAFYFLKKHQQVKDSVEGSAVLLQIKSMQEQFQSEKKQQEIELLKKDKELHVLALGRERTNVTLIAIALFSVIVISVLLINRNRIVSQARRDIELEKVRNHIARDLHDDIGSTLSSINIISELAQKGDAERHLRQITAHSARMMENMSDIVWSINPKNDSIEQVILKMKEFAFEILEPKGISHAFDVDESVTDLKLSVETRKNLFLIFKEAINNAAKHSGASEVHISLHVKQKLFYFLVSDNGTGFDMTEIRHGNGLINMKDRANSSGGILSQISEPGKGARVELLLPLT